MRYRTTVALSFASLSACTTGAVPSSSNGTPLGGEWGGVHAGLSLTAAGGAINYDCAHGGLSAAVVPDRAGRFDVAGVHVREHGGPVRIDEVPDSLPARFLGEVNGTRMTLRVLVGADTLGPFDLQRGVSPQIFRCL